MAFTYLDTLSAFTTFLTAYTHTLLYLRTLYPRTSFVQSRFHNTAVYQSRHPLVCDWIRDAIAAVREELLEGTVGRIGIVVFSYGGHSEATGSAQIMERYMFDVGQFPVVGKNERNMELVWDDSESDMQRHGEGEGGEDTGEKRGGQQALDADVDTDLSEQFRAALIALTTRTGQLSPLPPHCSFSISMELKDEVDVGAPVGHPQPWVPVQPSLQKTGRGGGQGDGGGEGGQGSDVGGVRVTPIRSVEAGVFRFETWVEEGQAKLQREGEKDAL
jgi:mitotic spindle assembly checkpoint protein MAD2B